MCRKLLMHMAVEKADAEEGKTFAHYVDKLVDSGQLPLAHKDLLTKIRQDGNGGTHELESVKEVDAVKTLKVTQLCLTNLYEAATY